MLLGNLAQLAIHQRLGVVMDLKLLIHPKLVIRPSGGRALEKRYLALGNEFLQLRAVGDDGAGDETFRNGERRKENASSASLQKIGATTEGTIASVRTLE